MKITQIFIFQKHAFPIITFNNYSDTGGYILDHIFYGGNVTPEQYDVVTNDYGVKYISDHYPVIFKCSYK